ncbi:MAG: UDP-N-acetylmuramoyl-L-alanyl-D-glutamate--2,6-diaminopimelate ligase [Bacteroidales bacterium]|nr:UDP-N-acetylmuramoyl-L-alanyl-D-glutamate--2,6-diaminopimelate ligase [Bacteroidales bacterium]MEE1001271.1 UDP-N-acetylmuramoyl-L-alanyl-D-glutamate--2,6-diaminopimelate ligase [Bacteroidales bacterium]
MELLSGLLNGLDIIQRVNAKDVQINQIEFDSRKVCQGTLFVAQRGVVSDGHNYLDSAISNGAVAVVVEELPQNINDEVVYIQVENSSYALGILAKNYFHDPSSKLKLVGITGTNGKTTTATLSYDLFSSLGYCCGLISTIVNKIADKNFPTERTTPDVLSLNKLLLEMVEAKCEFVFMEVSSHAVVQHRIAGLSFFGGVFSNITHDHLDYHKTFTNYINAKKGFFDSLSSEAFALTNIDDKNGEKMVESTKARKYTYSLSRLADYKTKIVENCFEGLLLNINGKDVNTMLVGRFNAYNLTAIYAIARLCGLDDQETLVGLSKLKAAAGRFEPHYLKNGATAIVDYAHTPDALENVLSTINSIRTTGVLVTVVGCGGDRDKTKRPQMASIAHKGSDILILTSDNPRTESPESILKDMNSGINDFDKVFTITDRREAIKLAAQLTKGKGDIILIAGKGHETYQEINGVKYHFDDKEEIAKY